MIIITANVHSCLTESFEKKGRAFQYLPAITYDELAELIPAATGLVITTRIQVDAALLSKATNLRWIGRLGSGLELIDQPAAAALGITLLSTPEGNANAVAEMAVGTMLSLLRHIRRSANEVEDAVWKRDENRGTEISDKTIGIYGYGHTGSRFAQVLSGFGCRILAYDKYKSGFGNSFVTESTAANIFEEADIISFHLPLTAETHHLAGGQLFNALEKQPLIINTSRGKVIDQWALINALEQKKIRGAALDVLEDEKISTLTGRQKEAFDILRQHPQVLLTPHIAGYSHEAYYKMSAFLIQKLEVLGLI